MSSDERKEHREHREHNGLGPLEDGLPQHPSKRINVREDIEHLRLIERKVLGLK